ncbi:hypothetical protein U3516DRAFT_633682 [Neocallimastix sp. 'constans']|jgi:hypothetical protein
MRKNNEIIFKVLIVILLSSILLITLVKNTNNNCELNKGNDIKKFNSSSNMKNVEVNIEPVSKNNESKNENVEPISKNDKNKDKFDIDKINFDNVEIPEHRIYYLNTKILYFSRHEGTIANFSTIAKLLSFEVTVLEPWYSFEERPECFEEDKCKSYVEDMCGKYDYIVVSDIIPDSYIYLINADSCGAKIVLEITNRFDLFVKEENRDDYLRNFGKAILEHDNIVVVENNPFETYFACTEGVFIPKYYLIRPIGYAPPAVMSEKHNEVHNEIAFIDHSGHDATITLPQLENLGVEFTKLPHRYGGPLVLATYKALLMLPYQVSIMKMMENFRYGVAMILPSERLFKELLDDFRYEFTQKELNDVEGGISNYVEFYNSEFKDLFVYFDKWEDLPSIIENTDFDAKKRQVKEFMVKYEKKALTLWAEVLDIIPSENMIINEKPLCNANYFYNYKNKSI